MVSEVLRYVQYDKGTLIEKVRRTIEIAMRSGQITLEESARLRRHYEQGLQEYTYLSRDDRDPAVELVESKDNGRNGTGLPTPAIAAAEPQ